MTGEDAGAFKTPGAEDRAEAAGRHALRLIAINPTLRAEAERLLPLLENAKTLATREEIITVMVREMPAWGVSTKHAGEHGVTYASYAEALDGLPLYAIEEAVTRWNRAEGHDDLRMSGFPPRPAQLFTLASDAKRELYTAAWRAKLALEYVENRPAPPQTEEERNANSAAIRSMLAKGRAHFPPQPPGIAYMDWVRHCRENNLIAEGPPAPTYTGPRISPQEMAANLRASAAPKDHDPGDVI